MQQSITIILFLLFSLGCIYANPLAEDHAHNETSVEKFLEASQMVISFPFSLNRFELLYNRIFPTLSAQLELIEHEHEGHAHEEEEGHAHEEEAGHEDHEAFEMNCFQYEVLFNMSDVDMDGSLDEHEMMDAGAWMVGMYILGCNETVIVEENLCAEDALALKWVFGIGASLVVSLVGLVGVVLIPTSKGTFSNSIKRFFYALAVGVMLGDVVIHIIPAILGAHGHGEETGSENEMEYLILCSLICFFYFFFNFIDIILHVVCGHSHLDDEEGPDEEHSHGNVGYLILFGDAIHNFLDGVSVGVSFSASLTAGLSTTIAVVLHELPQGIFYMFS